MMGRERAVIRWEVRQQMLLDELQRVEQELAASEQMEGASVEALQERLKELRAKLHKLGPTPRAKMG
jgi:coenzyme F420-reducing hydrogenase delta subunit